MVGAANLASGEGAPILVPPTENIFTHNHTNTYTPVRARGSVSYDRGSDTELNRIQRDIDVRCNRPMPHVNSKHSMFSFLLSSLCHMILAGNCTYDTSFLPHACVAKQHVEYFHIPADFKPKPTKKNVHWCTHTSTELLWRKHDKMCEEDRMEPSARAEGEMLEEMQALNSDPDC